jgi:hypothetical protein
MNSNTAVRHQHGIQSHVGGDYKHVQVFFLTPVVLPVILF